MADLKGVRNMVEQVRNKKKQDASSGGPAYEDRDDVVSTENADDVLTVPADEVAAEGAERRSVEEVRQGHTGDGVRYILLASFIGAVLALYILYSLFWAAS